MNTQDNLEILKLYAKTQLDVSTDEVLFAEIINNEIIWRLSSKHFDLSENELESYLKKEEIINAIKGSIPKEFLFIQEESQKKIIISVFPMVSLKEHSVRAFLTIRIILHPMVIAFDDYAPIIAQIFKEGSLITLTNKNTVIDVNRSDKYDVPMVVPGFPLDEFDVIQDAIKTKKCVHSEDNSMVYGPPTKIQATPYFYKDSNEVVGSLNIIRPRQTEYNLLNLSENMEKQLSEVTNIIQEVARASETIHTNEQNLYSSIEEITDIANKIFTISDLIRSVADSTKMLGLNASIEAARAGNYGKGFRVVADEINKLSEKSRNTVPIIKKLTEDIKTKVEESKQKSQISVDATQEQVAATEEITASLEELRSESVELANMANEI